MGLHWSSICIKYLLFAFNLLFVISGIIILSVGISIKAYYNDYELFLDDKYFSAPNLLIAIGVIIFLIAFFGCCGALKENFCMTITFSTLLILICVLEFAAGISGYVLRNQTEEYLAHKLNDSMYNYGKNHSEAVTQLWDGIQREFHCCGVHGYEDWLNVTQSLPVSCCKPEDGILETFKCTPDSPTLWKSGCVNSFGGFVAAHAVTIGSLGLSLAFIQFIGIVFSCHLSRQIKKNYETV